MHICYFHLNPSQGCTPRLIAALGTPCMLSFSWKDAAVSQQYLADAGGSIPVFMLSKILVL